MVEKHAQHWVTRLPKALQSQVKTLTPICEGRADSCFIQFKNNKPCFVKFANEQQIMKEKQILFHLSQHKQLQNVAPKLIDHKQDKQLLMTKKVIGTSPTKAQVLSIDNGITPVLARLHQHAIMPSELNFEPPNADAFLNVLTQSNISQSDITLLVKKLNNAYQRISDLTQYSALNHGDLTAFNILHNTNLWTFVDWEYACVVDVRWDIATLSIEFDLTETEDKQLIQTYLKHGFINDDNFYIGFTHWRFVYLVTCFIWAVEQNTDVEKYTALLLQHGKDSLLN